MAPSGQRFRRGFLIFRITIYYQKVNVIVKVS